MKKAILLLMMLAAGRLFAQSHVAAAPSVKHLSNAISVSGRVKDTAGTALPGATVKLRSGNDSLIVATNIEGVFTFAQVKKGAFTLTVSSIGYRTLTKNITNISNSKNLVLDAIVLKPEQKVLQAITINGMPGVVYKVDTVLYKASPYKVDQNPQIAELLKKMENFQVGADGTVTRQGQSVTKMALNGKAYTGEEVRQAVKTLPANVLKEIQMLDNYGDQASLAGIKDPVVNNESYKQITEKGFQKPIEDPLSTFSVDVDAAAYSNVRRYINGGQLPPKDAVRIEEMINYFNYKLPEPKGDKPVAILTELSSAPWNPQHRLLRISLKAKTVSAEKLPPGNLVFLIDVSGSMNTANKLPLVRSSMKMLVEQLRPQDKVAIVVYAGNAGLVLAATPGNEKEKIDSAIDNLSAGGSTAGGAGIKLAYRIAKENFKANGNNRIILATDGDFNVGASSDESMEQLITKERESGVGLSIMGFGMGNYKDSKMETLADKGNGNYAYIDNITEARKALVTEFSGTLFTVAKDVKLQIEFNPAKVQAYRLIGYDDRLLAAEDFNNDKKDAGDMGAGHNVTAFYEIIPAGVKDGYAGNVDDLKYQKTDKVLTGNPNELLTIKFRYKDPGTDVSKLNEAVVKDNPVVFKNTSADYKFAASVVEFGMLLHNSEFKQNASYDDAIRMAQAGKADDKEGYRSEFIRLVESAKLIAKGELAAR